MERVGAFELTEGPEYAYVQVANHLEKRIRAGELPPRSRLPGERELAAEYGVALGTIRRAMQEMRERGLATTTPSKGTFITDAPPAQTL
jgi:DNA-binding GntR family transcriptional regulator